jgi:hypothetical protein
MSSNVFELIETVLDDGNVVVIDLHNCQEVPPKMKGVFILYSGAKGWEYRFDLLSGHYALIKQEGEDITIYKVIVPRRGTPVKVKVHEDVDDNIEDVKQWVKFVMCYACGGDEHVYLFA